MQQPCSSFTAALQQPYSNFAAASQTTRQFTAVLQQHYSSFEFGSSPTATLQQPYNSCTAAPPQLYSSCTAALQPTAIQQPRSSLAAALQQLYSSFATVTIYNYYHYLLPTTYHLLLFCGRRCASRRASRRATRAATAHRYFATALQQPYISCAAALKQHYSVQQLYTQLNGSPAAALDD